MTPLLGMTAFQAHTHGLLNQWRSSFDADKESALRFLLTGEPGLALRLLEHAETIGVRLSDEQQAILLENCDTFGMETDGVLDVVLPNSAHHSAGAGETNFSSVERAGRSGGDSSRANSVSSSKKSGGAASGAEGGVVVTATSSADEEQQAYQQGDAASIITVAPASSSSTLAPPVRGTHALVEFPTDKLKVDFNLQYPKISAVDTDFMGVVSLTAPDMKSSVSGVPNEETRHHRLGAPPPVELTLVIDCSHTMANDNRFYNAKQACLFCLEALHRGDRLSVITFSEQTEMIFPLTEIGENRRRLAQLIQEISFERTLTTAGRNLGEGFGRAVEQWSAIDQNRPMADNLITAAQFPDPVPRIGLKGKGGRVKKTEADLACNKVKRFPCDGSMNHA